MRIFQCIQLNIETRQSMFQYAQTRTPILYYVYVVCMKPFQFLCASPNGYWKKLCIDSNKSSEFELSLLSKICSRSKKLKLQIPFQ